MADFDVFASTLLEESKRFVEKASEANGGTAEAPNLHAALMLAFCALEAHVNAVADEMARRDNLTPHVLGVLLEKDVRLFNGKFELDNRLKIFRLEDRIYLLHDRFGTKPDVHGSWRPALSSALDLRNKLTHPKGGGSCRVPGWCRIRHATRPAMRVPSRALPRRRALCTNWKKPR